MLRDCPAPGREVEARKDQLLLVCFGLGGTICGDELGLDQLRPAWS